MHETAICRQYVPDRAWVVRVDDVPVRTFKDIDHGDIDQTLAIARAWAAESKSATQEDKP